MRTYQLYVRIDGAWVWRGTIDAISHAEAFRLVLLNLQRGDEDHPIRIESDLDGAYRKPLPEPEDGGRS